MATGSLAARVVDAAPEATARSSLELGPTEAVTHRCHRCIEGMPEFVEVPGPTDEAVQSVLRKIITRMMKLLTRRNMVEEEGST